MGELEVGSIFWEYDLGVIFSKSSPVFNLGEPKEKTRFRFFFKIYLLKYWEVKVKWK